jgi:hypothetical protein
MTSNLDIVRPTASWRRPCRFTYRMINFIESNHIRTAKAQRTRREKPMNKTKEEIE